MHLYCTCTLSSPVVTRCHPLSPDYPVVTHCCPLPLVITCDEPSSPVITPCPPLSLLVLRCHSLSSVVILRHPLSPVTTPLDELSQAYAYYCIPVFMNYMPIKFQNSILINKTVVKGGTFVLPPPLRKSCFTGHWLLA